MDDNLEQRNSSRTIDLHRIINAFRFSIRTINIIMIVFIGDSSYVHARTTCDHLATHLSDMTSEYKGFKNNAFLSECLRSLFTFF